MKYELILFDADETLFDFKKSERYAFMESLSDFKINYDKEECMKIYSEINTAIWKEFEKGTITSDKLKVERFNRLFKRLSVDKDAEKFSKAYMNHLSEASFIYNEAFEILDYLKDKYRLAIITNGLLDVQNKRIRESKIEHYFQEIIISDEIKIAKPMAKIFDYTLEKLNFKDKSKVLMIGDSLTSDIQGGINAEIDTCWFNVNNKEKPKDMDITYVINNILELKNIL
ncbi:YjjG family noncanonical pyrimidine nucleotidase [Clostridium celatum]|uniref:HAD hydrolase family n=1 Tax=Clostridium celatum DSM 1785 TaxID=545697 RepID=L1QHJ8_9CLOT|nr:YjjG family noncanonical pyrimidine nucleotidase [Clostridium celatum]EKY27401.1 HAD hydrolase family [Clostridium celatum DSM 1785]MCE9655863.1 YjjG family noncanonical pyrimidine nucleotidase [Clostridium celatum]